MGFGSAKSIGLALLAALVCLPAKADPPPGPAFEGYLFVHFTGESALGEQIHFSVSTNGLNWCDLNNAMPVLRSNVGEKGVRDPAIIRSSDGRRFYILATDLRIASGKGWQAALHEGSLSLVFWQSTDLIHWSEPWTVDVAGRIPGAGCAWAPEAIYDDTTGEYVVYWATYAPRDGVREARIYCAKTRDFRTFSPPELYIERVGTGVYSKDIIDTQILKVEGGAYPYYRASRDSQITIEGADRILGEWTRIGDVSHLGFTAQQVEGPILFQFNNERKWCLLVDQYATSRGYLPLVTSDLTSTTNFQVLEADQYSLGGSLKRHGGILNITRSEFDSVVAKWPSVPSCRIESLARADHYVRHANYVARVDADVQPAQDALWRIVAGLASERGAVSLQSVNLPDHFLVQNGTGFALEPNDGTNALARRASFLKVPGLANPSDVSFRLIDDDNEYLLNQEAVLRAGTVDSEQDKEGATFRILE